MSRLRAFRRCTAGAAAVEFAIVGGLLIVLVVGIIDFGRTYYIKNQLSHLADKAARTVLINPDVTDAVLEDQLRAGFSAGDPDTLTVEIREDPQGGTNYRQVIIGFPVSLFVPGLNSGTIALSVTRRVPVP